MKKRPVRGTKVAGLRRPSSSVTNPRHTKGFFITHPYSLLPTAHRGRRRCRCRYSIPSVANAQKQRLIASSRLELGPVEAVQPTYFTCPHSRTARPSHSRSSTGPLALSPSLRLRPHLHPSIAPFPIITPRTRIADLSTAIRRPSLF